MSLGPALSRRPQGKLKSKGLPGLGRQAAGGGAQDSTGWVVFIDFLSLVNAFFKKSKNDFLSLVNAQLSLYYSLCFILYM